MALTSVLVMFAPIRYRPPSKPRTRKRTISGTAVLLVVGGLAGGGVGLVVITRDSPWTLHVTSLIIFAAIVVIGVLEAAKKRQVAQQTATVESGIRSVG